MHQLMKKNDFLLVNVPLLRPAWPVPTFSRTIPLLKSHGFQVDWWDENIKFFRYYYSEKKISLAYQLVEEKMISCINPDHKLAYSTVLEQPVEKLLEAISDISKSETFADMHTFQDVFNTVFIDCASVLSHAFDVVFDYNQLIYKSPLGGKGYNFVRAYDVIELVSGAPQNISLEFFKESTLPRIKEFAPKILGISISSGFELVPAFTLAKLVKDSFGDDIHVTIGGNFFSRVEHRFRNAEPEKELYKVFWKWMDSFVYSKGDYALLKLVDCIRNNKEFKSVPNLVYKSGSSIIENDFEYGPSIDELPPSNFGSVLDQRDQYFVPPEYLTVPIYTSIGCSYAKCTFCAIDKMSGNFHGELSLKRENGIKFLKGKNGDKSLFFRQIDKIIQEISDIKSQYGIRYFSFNDETFDMDFAYQFAKEVIKQDLDIYWQAFARAEDSLTSPDFCRTLYQGGCRLLRIGFEYLSQDMLNQTHKGYSLNKQRLIVDALNEAGIWIHAYFMIGTEDDYENAINFFNNNTEFYELFHTLEFFSQVDDRHSLEKLQKLSKGLINNADLDVNFPQFRIWYDLYPRARYLVKNLRRYAQDHFLLYGHFYEPSEVAYFPVLNNLYGLNNLKQSLKKVSLETLKN